MIALSSKRWHGVVGRGEVDFLRQRRGDLDESHQLFPLHVFLGCSARHEAHPRAGWAPQERYQRLLCDTTPTPAATDHGCPSHPGRSKPSGSINSHIFAR